MARPKNTKPLKDKVITTKVTAQEYEMYTQLAEDMQLNISIIIRLAMTDYIRKVKERGGNY